jgi:hypothetical protein
MGDYQSEQDGGCKSMQRNNIINLAYSLINIWVVKCCLNIRFRGLTFKNLRINVNGIIKSNRL